MKAIENTFTNHFLIATPSAHDSIFAQSVIYVCEHNAEGAIGIIVNRPLKLEVGELFNKLSIEATSPVLKNKPVLFGGPVGINEGMIIHRSSYPWKHTIKVADEVALSSSRESLETLAASLDTPDILVSLGYSGWSSGQLEEEIMQNAWLTAPATSDILFSTPLHQRWKAAAALIGIDMSRLSSEIGHA